MAHIRQIEEHEAGGLLKQVYDAAKARAGKVANIVKVMGLDPRAAEASMALYLRLMKSPGPLEPARREMVAAVVSNVNECYY
jgi:alkylhydroperoxidase family enzyme